MQLFARDEDGLISSDRAIKGRGYHCLECSGELRVREGLYRRRHFFHLPLQPSRCYTGTSPVHLAVQNKIIEMLPKGEAQIEKAFPQINRIADVVWDVKKILFEVQCSPIGLGEVRARMEDYARLGYRIIWILHDTLFNQKRLSAAEHFLRPCHAYFTSIDETGRGTIYDQHETFSLSRRIRKGAPCPVDLNDPIFKKKRRSRKGNMSIFDRLKCSAHLIYHLILKRANS